MIIQVILNFIFRLYFCEFLVSLIIKSQSAEMQQLWLQVRVGGAVELLKLFIQETFTPLEVFRKTFWLCIVKKKSPYMSYRNHGVGQQHQHILLLLTRCCCSLLVSSSAPEVLHLSIGRCRVRGQCSRLQPAAPRQRLHLGVQPEQLLCHLCLAKQQVKQTCWAQEEQRARCHRSQRLPRRENTVPLLHVCALFPGPPLQGWSGLWKSQAQTGHIWTPANKWGIRGELRCKLLGRSKHVKNTWCIAQQHGKLLENGLLGFRSSSLAYFTNDTSLLITLVFFISTFSPGFPAQNYMRAE